MFFFFNQDKCVLLSMCSRSPLDQPFNMLLKYEILFLKKQVKYLKKRKKALYFIFNISSHISFSELQGWVGIESLQDRQMNAKLSLFSRCVAEGIEPSFQYALEKKHNTTRGGRPICTIHNIKCSLLFFLASHNQRSVAVISHIYIFYYFFKFLHISFAEFLITLLLLLIYVLNIF